MNQTIELLPIRSFNLQETLRCNEKKWRYLKIGDDENGMKKKISTKDIGFNRNEKELNFVT